jgi:aminoglycoside phosphotransferase family enzyme/predicted kinase
MVDNQDEVVAFLSTPASYSPPEPVARIDTHSAIVFLSGARAYKLKRAVRYDYLDFSTRELRRAACEREVALNRRTAPNVYLGTRAITREPDGQLTFDGVGAPLDHVVQMARFDQNSLFDRLASRGELNLALMEELAEAVATAHSVAPRRVDQGGRAGIAWVIDGNAEGFRELYEVLDPDRCRHVIDRSREALDREGERLELRRLDGHVRECHGDLHLRNIVLLQGRPTLFDAVEFNDRISCIDSFYDTAFLLMDLWRLNLRVHANQFFNRYVMAADELAALPLLPLFLSCRSAVRAKTSATAARLQPDRTRAEELRSAAQTYLAAADTLLYPAAPRLVAVGGLAGTGKSTLAREIAPGLGGAPGALVVRSDVVRKSMFGVPATQRLGEDAYSPDVNRRVYARVADHASVALRAGHAAVVDAVFADARERAAIAAVADAAGASFTGLWLDAPFDVARDRIALRQGDASDATVDVLSRQQTATVGAINWMRLDASGDPEQVKASAESILSLPACETE